MVGSLPANAGDMGLIPGLGDSTCPGAIKPRRCSYRARIPQLLNEAHAAQQEKPAQ